MPFSHNEAQNYYRYMQVQSVSHVNKYNLFYRFLYGNVHGCVFAKNRPVFFDWSDYTITYLNERNHNSSTAYWIIDCQKMWARVPISVFCFSFFFHLFQLLVASSFFLAFVLKWIYLFESDIHLCIKYTRSSMNNFNKPTCN